MHESEAARINQYIAEQVEARIQALVQQTYGINFALVLKDALKERAELKCQLAEWKVAAQNALALISQVMPTPVEGYQKSPHLLLSDLQRIIKDLMTHPECDKCRSRSNVHCVSIREV